MAVMARDAWTDRRLDQLNGQVGAGFEEMRTEFKAVQAEMRTEFKAVRAEMHAESKALRGDLQEELRGIRSEMGAFHRAIIQLVWAIAGTIFLGFMGTIAALVSLV
jgi:predicted phage gp36 major capsid-like protein